MFLPENESTEASNCVQIHQKNALKTTFPIKSTPSQIQSSGRTLCLITVTLSGLKSHSEMNQVVEEPLLDPNDNPIVGGFHQAEWDDKTVCELEKLLTENLHAHFKHAIKTIVGCGYKEHDAETIILRSKPFHSNGDILSSILTGALASVNITKEPHLAVHQNFENLESLVKYTLLEMMCVLKEVQPSLTVLEAMWLIFVSDFNLSNAYTKEIGSHGSSSQATMGRKDTEPTNAKPTLGNPGGIYPIPKFALKHLVPGGQSSGQSIRLTVEPPPQLSKNSHVIGEKVRDSYQRSVGEGNQSKLLSDICKREMLLQKEFLLEKSNKGRTSKGAFKARFMPLKSGAGSSGSIMKNSCSKISTSSGSVSENIYHHKTDSTSLPPVAGTPKLVKDADFDNQSSSAISSYYAGIPYDTNLKKYIPQDEKDEAILELVPCLEKLEKIKQGWTDWANQKFHQGMTRIQNVKAEMKTVKKELEEAEKLHIKNHTKRHVEMEKAWASAVSQAESTESHVRRLEIENSTLSFKMKSAESKALESARDVQKALQQEQIVLKNSQSIDLEKRVLQEEFTSEKRNAAELARKLEKAKVCLKQFEDQWKKENKEKLKYLSEAETFRDGRKQLEALAKTEEKAIRERSRSEIQKCREKIKKLETEMSVLKLEYKVSRIGIPQTRTVMDCGSSSMGSKSTHLYPGVHALSGVDQRLLVNNYVEIDKKRERECVVCLAEERSVLFLPCAHQVVCTQCIMQHGKEMNECPSCRTPIQRRIQVRYNTSD